MDLEEALTRIAALEHKVSRLYQHVGVAEPVDTGGDVQVSPEVQEALAANNLMKAIKTHHDQTGKGLAEAKQEVETWWARSSAG
jgi:ribosomal protein L7/L12